MSNLAACPYPKCPKYPLSLLNSCGSNGCNNKLHHCCQTDFELENGIDGEMRKRCYMCLMRELTGKASANLQVTEENSESKEEELEEDNYDPIDEEEGQKQPAKDVIVPDESNNEGLEPKKKAQKGLQRNSVLLSPHIYMHHDKDKRGVLMDKFTKKFGPFAYGKVVQVPNKKKNINAYRLEYDERKGVHLEEEDVEFGDLCKEITGNKIVKQLLQRGVEIANMIDYRFNLSEKGSTTKRKRRSRRGTTNRNEEGGGAPLMKVVILLLGYCRPR